MCLADTLASSDAIHVVAHSDMDGIASAAIVGRWARRRGIAFTWDVVGVRSLYRILVSRMREALSKPQYTMFLVVDIAPRHSDAYVYASLVRKGRVELAWVDHHEWSTEVRSYLERAGVKVFVDRSDVTAANVCRLLDCSGDPVSAKLVELARYDDSCKPDPEGLVGRWRIVLRTMPPEEAGKVIESFIEGCLWPTWAQERYDSSASSYREQIASTHVSIYDFEGVRILVAVPPPTVSACDLELSGVIKLGEGVEVAVIVYPRSISIRTTGTIDANCVARRLGGGGHRRAAGAPRPSLSMGPAQIARMVAREVGHCRVSGG